ncbi:glycosyltransferase family 2 protein [Paenibacillus guangzhouensis]|uniref:glycosyltransferase family 2 protein n=1 Tax=Paenibacillus guangzhouensis TaxID=1473112 RepID=UPI0012673FC7|nr:hypothetical protein [Paenibacillus guangzhouensis]
MITTSQMEKGALMAAERILIGCPVHQSPQILACFLDTLQHLHHHTPHPIDYLFIDDNLDPWSSELLLRFAYTEKSLSPNRQITVLSSGESLQYEKDEVTHQWNNLLIWKVARFKDRILSHAREARYDYLFLIDSDVLIQPSTLDQLIEAKKPIISEIFWTEWTPGSHQLPQVWLTDHYKMYRADYGEELSEEEIQTLTLEFLARLQVPGVYEVGGLGACTLIHRDALYDRISFGPISNLSFWGEDRHFCVRAKALGIPLFVDTHQPALHLYRASDLPKATAFFHIHRIAPVYQKIFAK